MLPPSDSGRPGDRSEFSFQGRERTCLGAVFAGTPGSGRTVTSSPLTTEHCALDLCVRKTAEQHLKPKCLPFLEIPETVMTRQELC